MRHEPGAKEFAAVYLDHFDAVYDASFSVLALNPLLGPAMRARTEQQRDSARELSRERVQEALDGDWDSYADTLRYEGTTYAIRGLEFGVWEAVPRAVFGALTPVMIERLAARPALLNEAILSMNKFCQYTLAELGDAYVRTTEAQLRTWESLFQNLPTGICILEPASKKMRFANRAFRDMYGLTDAELRGRTWASLFDPDDLERVRRIHDVKGYVTSQASYEALHVRKDGTRFPVLVDGVQIPSGKLDELSWGIGVRDLSERHQMEALRVRSTELEMENRRVLEGSRLKSEFLANMSHELRTPLNSILGFSELLVNGEVGELEDQQRDFVADIYTSGKHLLRLINDVLDLSKVEAGKMEFHPEDVELGALVHEVTGVLRGMAAERGVKIHVDVDATVGVVQLDASRLKQVLYNYLSNAIKFSAANGRVDVVVVAEGEESFRLEVRDEGRGIAEHDLQRLFVEFEQLDPGRAKTHGGTGLGLALTRRLVEAQGGAVGVRSVLGEGSVFYAVLPRFLPSTASLPSPRQHVAQNCSAPRVLVIEDDPEDQEHIVSSLIHAGYTVHTAASGAQALRALDEYTFDAITLDLLLPDTSGLALIQNLRKRPALASVPVIVISLVSEQVTSGYVVSDALQKPVQPVELLAALRRAGVAPPGTGPVLVVDDDETSTRLVAATLGQLGFRVVVAHDGLHALERARHETPIAVVLDLVMPNLDGFGFLREFRKESAWCKVPVLVWTVRDLSGQEQRTLLADAAAVLSKDGSGLRTLVETLRLHVAIPSEVS